MYRKASYVSSIKQCFKFEEIRDCFVLAIGAVSSFVLPFDYNPLLIASLEQVDMWIAPSVMIHIGAIDWEEHVSQQSNSKWDKCRSFFRMCQMAQN